MRFRAVIFDLWETLVDWPVDDARQLTQRIAAHTGLDDDAFMRAWEENYRLRETGPLAAAYRALGLPEEHIEVHVAARHELARRALRPRDGVVATLDELRRRGLKLGLISVCSEEVPAVWPQTPLAARFDATTFSSECGVMKPEPEIYLRTADALGIDPVDTLYVGDGANDELRGAREVGMTPVLIAETDREPWWPEVRDWSGPRIAAIPEVLELVE
ncbi:MAG TPA: HAD family hydrolase [Gaiellaceae bacterium]